MMLPSGPLLTPDDLAVLLNVERTTVLAWSRAGRLPEPIRLTDRTLRWSQHAVNDWLTGFGIDRQAVQAATEAQKPHD
ncbi:MAG: helix-turn-helix transcriptional regulator [Pirellulaceae bacterium]